MLLLALSSLTLLAADARLQQTAGQLSDRAQQLSEEAYNGFRRRDRGNRADVEALYATVQFRSGTELFRRMVDDNRPQSELRDGVLVLREQLSRMDRYAFGQQERSRMNVLLQDMERQLGARSSAYPSTPTWDRGGLGSGRLTWSGRVDDEVILTVRGSRVSVRVVDGNRVEDEDYRFDSPLPRRETELQVRKTRGRGSVDLIQEPSRENDFTAMIRIRDNRGGSDNYDIEVSW